MRTILIAMGWLLLTQQAASQTPPDTFSAGYGDFVGPFQVNDSYDSCRVAILLPEVIDGRLITGIRARFDAPYDGGEVSESTWSACAAFTWAMASGSAEEPGSELIYLTSVPLKDNPGLRTGGWLSLPVEWEVYNGSRYWLIGYWQQEADFVRLTQMQHPQSTITVAANTVPWQFWSGGGLMVEVAHIDPSQWTPSGIFDSPADEGQRANQRLKASIAGSELVISLADSFQPYRLTIVNILGQTIVDEKGDWTPGEIRLPWSANRPSGVYFCRVSQGIDSYTVPFVNLK